MRTIIVILTATLCVWLQVAWFGHLRPLGVMPNLIIILVTVCGLWLNATSALASAVVGGFLLDLAAGDGNFGLRTAFFTLMAFAIITIRQLGIHTDSVITGSLAVIVATVVYNLAVLATIGGFYSPVVVGTIAREVSINLTITVALYIIRANIGARARTTLELGPRIR